jgi:hypothetical protein
VVYRDRGYFGAKSKGYDATMKRAVKEHPQENSSSADIEEHYFQGCTDGYHAYEHERLACVVVK